MRNTFSEALYNAASADPNVYVVVADIAPAGSMVKFREQYPDRFINVGVAEQSMIGICAGLALRGCQPFAYTIATFTLYRPFEMVRDDLLGLFGSYGRNETVDVHFRHGGKMQVISDAKVEH